MLPTLAHSRREMATMEWTSAMELSSAMMSTMVTTAIEPPLPPMTPPQPPSMPPPPPTRLTYDGMAMYVGPLKGCTVFVDANGNGVHDSGALLTPILTVNPHPHLTLTPQPSTSTPTLTSVPAFNPYP